MPMLLILLITLLATAPSAGAADAFPSKPIRLLVPFTPGGGADLVARMLAPRLAERLGQSVVVDNRPAASGVLATEMAARATPDGHTLLVATSNFSANSAFMSKLPYDTLNDFAPVTQAVLSPLVMVIHPSVKATTVKEFIALAKKEGSKISFGSSGSGATDHLAGEVFNTLAGLQMTHIPYKGGAPAMVDLVGGQVQVVFATVSTAISSIQGGKIRALGMTGNQRFERLPELPTIAEAGLVGFEVNNWYGLYAPAGTPKDIITKLNTEAVKILAMPDVKTRLLDAGIIATPSSPEAFAAYMQAETKKWAKVVKDAKIKTD